LQDQLRWEKSGQSGRRKQLLILIRRIEKVKLRLWWNIRAAIRIELCRTCPLKMLNICRKL